MYTKVVKINSDSEYEEFRRENNHLTWKYSGKQMNYKRPQLSTFPYYLFVEDCKKLTWGRNEKRYIEVKNLIILKRLGK